MPGWRDEIGVAIDFWISIERGATAPRWTRIGPARPEAERGWYAVDIRGSRANIDQIDALRLAGATQPTEVDGYRVLNATQDGQRIRVKVADFVGLADAQLWQLKQPATHLIIKLREELATCAEGFADDLVHRRLGPVPRARPATGDFTPAQLQAYDSCFQPGVRLVWGPPGTGKTSVLRQAIADLVAAGKRVLLVSSTNIAVDNALLGVLERGSYAAGTLVRVGPAHLMEVARNEAVSLTHLTAARLTDAEAHVNRLEEQLAGLREADEALAALDRTLADFDPDAYQRVQALLANVAAMAELTARLDAAVSEVGRHDETVSAAEVALAGARAELAATAESSAALDQRDTVKMEVRRASSTVDSARAEHERAQLRLSQMEADLATASVRPFRFWRSGEIKRRQAAVDEHARYVQRLAEYVQRRQEAFESYRTSTVEYLAALTPRITFTRADIAARRDAVGEAQRQLAQARTGRADAAAVEESARAALLAAQAVPPPTEEQLAAVRRADERNQPALHAQRLDLRARAAAGAAQRSERERQYAEAQRLLSRLRKDAEGEVIRGARVVATTLARMRMARVLLDGPYDVVLVDEVGAANLPEVLLAVSTTKSTAVLLGDFMQLGAVLPAKVRDCTRPDVRTWLLPDVFEYCGITTAQAARTHSGCTVLDVQHRFGHRIMELANRIAYGATLTAGPGVPPLHPASEPEIVFVDTDGLGELAMVHATGRSKGWWPAGALLSRVIAEYHRDHDHRVGVVTPYGDQAEATLEALRDSESGSAPLTEVGTAHRFQGREFDIVVFDLVEDAYAERWMARAELGDAEFARNGVKLFNVAVTRTKRRLYLIGSRTRIDKARRDLAGADGVMAPFGFLAQLLDSRGVQILPAVHLITATAPPAGGSNPAKLGPSGTAIAQVLARYVRVSEILNEATFYATLATHIDAARDSIWIWSPWTATRVRSVLPALATARARGVAVYVFVRSPQDRFQGTTGNQRFLADLRAVATRVVEVKDLHQKIVVVDGQTILIGSLNPLSQRASTEVMLAINGAHFARKVLAHERAADLTRPAPTCGACGSQLMEARRDLAGEWSWHCYAVAGGDASSRRCRWNTKVRAASNQPPP